MWKTKSKVQWLTTPELNAKFFHLSTVIRRRRNCIESLKAEARVWLDSRTDIGNHTCQFFKDFFLLLGNMP